jgi:Glycosyl hydrolase family 3 C-terminal domain/Glycosyl hydrolase family 3 N terminal domain/Fibronectin type III-like domain
MTLVRGVRSVMHSYAEIDGLPVACDPRLLTDLLRGRWGFDGTVVADYFGVAFLHTLHGVAADLGDAAAQALTAGVDVELPTGNAYLTPLLERVRAGVVDEALVDRAVLRVLCQKCELGLFDETFEAEPTAQVDLDPAGHRQIAAMLAQESVVLLANDGVLPLTGWRRVAVIGPNADRAKALFGGYSFTNHVLGHHPDVLLGFAAPTVLEGLQSELADSEVTFAAGCAVDDTQRSGFPGAIRAVHAADVAILIVGDQAGLFGRGTVGEGCDRDNLDLPGVQRDLVEAVLATGTPVVLVLVTGRPYAVSWALQRCAAVVQAFFPGEEGAAAIAGVISGRVNPSGRLPVTLPRSAGAQPYSYLHPPLGGPTTVSNLPTAPGLPFGHGLSYTTFEHADLAIAGDVEAGGSFVTTVRVTNTGPRAGTDVVQLYGHDVVASITQPTARLLGYRRLVLEPGESAVVRFVVPTARLAFSDRDLVRVVEPGDVELWVGPSCEARETEARLRITGQTHQITVDNPRWTTSELLPA